MANTFVTLEALLKEFESEISALLQAKPTIVEAHSLQSLMGPTERPNRALRHYRVKAESARESAQEASEE